MSIYLEQINKYYGRQKALDNVGFSLKEGEICGFLGPNGAGKSTTMKIITGVLTDFEGKAEVCGMDIRRFPIEAKRCVGYLPEQNPLYPEMYVREYLLHVARLYRMDHASERVEDMIEMTGLASESRKKIGQLSKGYRQRVGLAQALVHEPRVLILDEPMTGLDPNQLEEIRALIVKLGHDKTVLFSTHIMQEVQAVCNRLIIINRGQVIADRTVESLETVAENGKDISVCFAPGVDAGWLASCGLFKKVRQNTTDNWTLTMAPDKDVRVELFHLAAEHNCPIVEMKIEKMGLEDVFHSLTR